MGKIKILNRSHLSQPAQLGVYKMEIQEFLKSNPSTSLASGKASFFTSQNANLLLNEPEKTLQQLNWSLKFQLHCDKFAFWLSSHSSFCNSSNENSRQTGKFFCEFVVRVILFQSCPKRWLNFNVHPVAKALSHSTAIQILEQFQSLSIVHIEWKKEQLVGQTNLLNCSKNTSNFSKDECFDFQEVKVQEMVNTAGCWSDSQVNYCDFERITRWMLQTWRFCSCDWILSQ